MGAGDAETNTYWGETHHNTHVGAEHDTDMDRVCASARAHLDFLSTAYYTPLLVPYRPEATPAGLRGFRLERWKPAERIEREWAEVQEATRRANEDGAFVTFPGYEWHGDGTSGDHNVVYREEGPPVHRVQTLAELYDCLRGREAIASPHHTAYRVGLRGRDWSVHDDEISPFAEVYSVHGCSETDEELIGMRQNPHMGPGLAGGTYREALLRGLHLGAICSGDNFGSGMLSGTYGNGLAAVLAPELTRESLWKAFRARRVYGVSGDRIELRFTVDGEQMGGRVPADGPRRIRVDARGLDALDRIEILRGERVIATHCHQGTWEFPRPGRRGRFVLRLEAGWGPNEEEMKVTDREWRGELSLEDGRFRRAVPCWRSHGQEPPVLRGGEASFSLLSSPSGVRSRWQNANVFEFEADAASRIRLRLNGLEETGTVAEFAAGSRVMWYRDECVHTLEELGGLPPDVPERDDVYHHMGYKAKVHRVMPEAACAARFEIEDDEPFTGEIHYRVRVEQRNGQRAWSSPVWVGPLEEPRAR